MKFVISGYFGFRNMGDEAILAAMIEHLTEAAHGSEIVVLSKDPIHTKKAHNVFAVSRTDLLGISRELADADLFISGGGSLLQDVTSSRSVPYYLGLVTLAKAMRKPVFFYAQGIGPLNLKFSKFLVKTVGNLVEAIAVRDKSSLALLKSLGVTKPEMYVAADPVFGLKRGHGARKGSELLHACEIPTQGGPLVIVSVRPWLAAPGYIQAVVAACDDLVKTCSAIVVYVPFYRAQDAPISQACIELMQERAYMLDCHMSPGEILSIMEEADFVIGMRYHALVFAVATATPFVALSYDPKVDGLLSIVGERPGLSRDGRGMDSLPGYVKAAWRRREEMKASFSALAPKLAESAKHVAHLAVDTAKKGQRR
jgi:polysaccharide pyruvyl transferase CsaB